MNRTEDERQRAEGTRGTEDGLNTTGMRRRTLAVCLASVICLHASAAFPQDDVLRLVEAKRIELREKEDALKQEEQRLIVLRKEVDEKIEAYTKLLAQIEADLKKADQVRGEKIENVVKAYEVMPPEDAAARLTALDDETALLIISRMKSKKAGAVIALMAPSKAASLTKSMATLNVRKQ